MGPSHPATHGTIKFQLRLDGETIIACDTEIGYLHRGFEKMCEQGTWNQCVPYADRLNYASPLINNFIFTEGVESLLGISAPERCTYIRTILSELSRIADHLTCLGMAAAEVGAQTVAFYMNQARERIYNINQAVTGARVTVSYGRVGGLTRDVPEDFEPMVRSAIGEIIEQLDNCEKLIIHISFGESNCFLQDKNANLNQFFTQFLVIRNLGDGIRNNLRCQRK